MLKEDPKDPFLLYAIALEHAKNGEREKAIGLVEELLATQPDYLGAYYQLGQWFEQEMENEKAISVYEKGIVLAKKLGNKKTEGELRTALDNLE
jgi:tetratricopeptide (TPR) repeat protein